MSLLLKKVSISTVVWGPKNNDRYKRAKKKKRKLDKTMEDLIRARCKPCKSKSSVESAATAFTESGKPGSAITQSLLATGSSLYAERKHLSMHSFAKTRN